MKKTNRDILRHRLVVFAATALTFCVCVQGATPPVVTWASYPVRGGEHVVVHGGDWGEKPRIVLGDATVPATVLSDTGLAFPFPGGEEAIAEGRVVNAAGASRPFALNVPTPWWLQGDDGDASTPGGTLRIFGRALAPSTPGARAAKSRVRLGERELALERADVWSLDARIPADLAPGDYPVFVSNGLPGGREWYAAGTWTVAPRRAVWKDDRFNVKDYGAVANDDGDDSSAFEAACAAAAKNGGGTVFVPAGRYIMRGTLRLSPHVLLKGEDRALSQICWLDTMTPPENLIEGTHSFGIHDLFISSGQYRNGIAAVNDMTKADCLKTTRGTLTHDVSLKRLRIMLVSDQWRDGDRATFMKRYTMPGTGILLRNCRRAEIDDCVLYSDKDAMRTMFFIITGDYVRMANCHIAGSGWAVFGGDRVIFENNDANNCTYSISSVCRRMFWSRNRQTALFTNNREAVTHDGAFTAWYAKKRGTLGSASGVVKGTHVSLTLPPNIVMRGLGKQKERATADWSGYELQIVDGRGAGQTREIVSMHGFADITLDRPFDLAPDATSQFLVVAERRHLLYVDNDIEDAGVAIQLYGGVTDCVLARNRCRRAGGLHGEGRDYYGFLTCWYIQFIENVIEEGNCHRKDIGTAFSGVGTSLIGALPCNVGWPLSQSYALRRNEIWSNGFLYVPVKNAVVEGNAVRRSSVGIIGRREQTSLYLANNAFTDVDKPYCELDGAHFATEADAQGVSPQRAVNGKTK